MVEQLELDFGRPLRVDGRRRQGQDEGERRWQSDSRAARGDGRLLGGLSAPPQSDSRSTRVDGDHHRREGAEHVDTSSQTLKNGRSASFFVIPKGYVTLAARSRVTPHACSGVTPECFGNDSGITAKRTCLNVQNCSNEWGGKNSSNRCTAGLDSCYGPSLMGSGGKVKGEASAELVERRASKADATRETATVVDVGGVPLDQAVIQALINASNANAQAMQTLRECYQTLSAVLETTAVSLQREQVENQRLAAAATAAERPPWVDNVIDLAKQIVKTTFEEWKK